MPSATPRLNELARKAGSALLAAWVVWWAESLWRLSLRGASYTWDRVPFFGADFTTETDHAARLWLSGVDPYVSREWLFHYPPLVIRLFSWVTFFDSETALRIWIVALIAVLVLGALRALRVREKLGVESVPVGLALTLVLFSSPVIFALERSNFDLITLAAVLVACSLFERESRHAELLAGCILAVGPWVKLYPGAMLLGLVALRRWRALAGFVVAGVAIGLAAPAETVRSFESLAVAVERIKTLCALDAAHPWETYHPWTHSLSVAWIKATQSAASTPLAPFLAKVPPELAALALISLPALWVSGRVYKSDNRGALSYPLLAWLNALGSCIGVIANDYSLVFLPMAALAVCSGKDSRAGKAALLASAIAFQPFGLNVSGGWMLIAKLLALGAVGSSLVRRAAELDTALSLPRRSEYTAAI